MRICGGQKVRKVNIKRFEKLMNDFEQHQLEDELENELEYEGTIAELRGRYYEYDRFNDN